MTEQDSTTRSGSSTGGGLSTADLASAAQQTASSDGDTQVENRAVQGAGATPSTQSDGETAPLFTSDESQSFQSRWQDIQATFVDDPQDAVKQADSLVADCMKRLADLFAQERSKLEDQWASGGDVSTEDLRLALQRYRSFFDRLLSV